MLRFGGYHFLIVLTPLLACFSLQAQEWMGLEPYDQTIISLQTALDKNNNQTHSLDFYSTLGEYFSIDLSISKNKLNDNTNTFNSEQRFIQLKWLSSDELEVGVSQQFEGEKDQLEINQTQIQLNYTPYPWSVSISYSQGDVDIYTQRNRLILRSLPSSLNSDLTATDISLSWWLDDFTVTINQTNYDYEKDISLLSSRPILQLIVKPQALLHSAILLTQQQRLSLQIPFEERSFELHYLHLTSAVDASSLNVAQINWNESLTSNIQFVSSLSQTLIEKGPWSISVGFEWSI